MKKHEYCTVYVSATGTKSLSEKIQKTLEEKSKEGWRMSQFETLPGLDTIIVFEKEAG